MAVRSEFFSRHVTDLCLVVRLVGSLNHGLTLCMISLYWLELSCVLSLSFSL
jgi:hypothetical protein